MNFHFGSAAYFSSAELYQSIGDASGGSLIGALNASMPYFHVVGKG